jgi:hypothetical protein
LPLVLRRIRWLAATRDMSAHVHCAPGSLPARDMPFHQHCFAVSPSGLK